MLSGGSELSRTATAYTVSTAFGLCFLLSTALGASAGTALWRGAVVIAVSLPLARLLAAPVVSVVLDALAREAEQRREAAAKAKEKAA